MGWSGNVVRLSGGGRLGWLFAAIVSFWIVPVAALDLTPHGTQPQLQTPLESTSNCVGCHRGFKSPNNQFLPHSTWTGSMMANATRDPLFWAALDVANK